MLVYNVATHETRACQNYIEIEGGTYIVTGCGPNNRGMIAPQSIEKLQQYCDGVHTIKDYVFESLNDQFTITCTDISVRVYDASLRCVFQFDNSGFTFCKTDKLRMRWMIPIIHKYYKDLPRNLTDIAGLSSMGTISLSNNVEHILNQRLVYDQLANPDEVIREYLKQRRDFWLTAKAKILETFLFQVVTEPSEPNELVKDYLSRVPKMLKIFGFTLPSEFKINPGWVLSFRDTNTNIYIRIMMGYRPYPQRIYRFRCTYPNFHNAKKNYIYIDTVSNSVTILPEKEPYSTDNTIKEFSDNIYYQVNPDVYTLQDPIGF